MRITMSPQDYATAFHLLAMTGTHHENIGRVTEERILPRLPPRPSLLDVGAGPGTVTRRLAPRFGAVTLLEPNRAQLGAFQLEGARIVHTTLEGYDSPERYDVVLCSHVMYHVPLADWGSFVDRLLARVKPGGFCVIVLGAARGQNYELHRDFTRTVISSAQLLDTLEQKRLPHDVVPTENDFRAATLEEMLTLCRFFVLEDCLTAEKLAALSADETRQLEEKIRLHAERCRGADGVYRLRQIDDVVILPRP